MTDRETYTPGPAGGAQVRKGEENWTLVLVRELREVVAAVFTGVDHGIAAIGEPDDVAQALRVGRDTVGPEFGVDFSQAEDRRDGHDDNGPCVLR